MKATLLPMFLLNRYLGSRYKTNFCCSNIFSLYVGWFSDRCASDFIYSGIGIKILFNLTFFYSSDKLSTNRGNFLFFSFFSFVML